MDSDPYFSFGPGLGLGLVVLRPDPFVLSTLVMDPDPRPGLGPVFGDSDTFEFFKRTRTRTRGSAPGLMFVDPAFPIFFQRTRTWTWTLDPALDP